MLIPLYLLVFICFYHPLPIFLSIPVWLYLYIPLCLYLYISISPCLYASLSPYVSFNPCVLIFLCPTVLIFLFPLRLFLYISVLIYLTPVLIFLNNNVLTFFYPYICGYISQNKCLTNIYLYVSNHCLYFSILFVQLPPSVPYSMWEQLCLLLSSLYQYKCVSYSLV